VGNISLPNINFNPVFQTINTGDNLTKIAQQNNTTLQSLVNLKNIENPDLIKAGASLRVK
jgi:LysM repeat protein